ncbi:MAG: FAD binding domain-containing protein [Anaerolineaceae bacterium]|jgi:carbon-monoxide dehydrogenase medium subunit
MIPIKAYPNQMTDTHLLVNDFDYVQPVTVKDALELLNQHGDNARILAGGTHLLTMIKMEREDPALIIDINHITGLEGITRGAQGDLIIGPLTKIRSLFLSAYIKNYYPALAEACGSFGSTQIQEMATIGGNVCNASPASDTVPALMVYGAQVVLQGLAGSRCLPIENFLLSPGKTALEKDELVVAIILPAPDPVAASSFYKISRVSADLAKVNLAVYLVRIENQIQECRIAFGSVAPTVIRIDSAEKFLEGKKFSENMLMETGKLVSQAISPIDDYRSSAWYRRHLASVMILDALKDLWEKALTRHQKNSEPIALSEDSAPSPDEAAPLYISKYARQMIEIIVNGVKRQIWVTSKELLLNVLRERLQLTGAKYGCGLGECSACTVEVNGKPMLACLLLAASLNGKNITTIEGLQKSNGELDPLQEAFIEQAAFQCGYCTPGMIMTIKGLLNENPRPQEQDIRDYLKGNRCRCTGYLSVVRAVFSAVENSR